MWHILIPARLQSTRLPNKPLLDIGGLPMVVRVAQQALALKAQGHSVRVVVAADDASILQACTAHGVEAILTDVHHVSGSDRLAQAAQLLGLADEDLVVNVQGDEPLIPPPLIAQVASALQNAPQAVMATAVHEITDVADFVNPNVVKVVCNGAGMAQYFSRAPIPWQRDIFAAHGVQSGLPPIAALAQLPQLTAPLPLRHIGIYAYRVGFLKCFPTLPPSPLEQQESLEQLRVLWHGYPIAVCTAPEAPATGVDTPEDLQRVRELVAIQA